MRLGHFELSGGVGNQMVRAFECLQVSKLFVASTREISAKMTSRWWGARQADLIELCLLFLVRHSRVTPNGSRR